MRLALLEGRVVFADVLEVVAIGYVGCPGRIVVKSRDPRLIPLQAHEAQHCGSMMIFEMSPDCAQQMQHVPCHSLGDGRLVTDHMTIAIVMAEWRGRYRIDASGGGTTCWQLWVPLLMLVWHRPWALLAFPAEFRSHRCNMLRGTQGSVLALQSGLTEDCFTPAARPDDVVLPPLVEQSRDIEDSICRWSRDLQHHRSASDMSCAREAFEDTMACLAARIHALEQTNQRVRESGKRR